MSRNLDHRSERRKKPSRSWWHRSNFRKLAAAAVRDAPRWVFLGALLWAPWDYGGTTPGAIRRINLLLSVVVGLWLLEMAVRRRRPDLSMALVIPCALILLF